MDIRVPRLGEGADSGTVVNILVKEGDKVKKDQTLIELENEKAVAPIPSTADGVVQKIHIKLNDKITVGQAILTLSGSESGAQASAPKEAPSSAPRVAAPAVAPQQRPVQTGDSGYLYQSASGMEPPAAPSVRKLAHDLGIDLRRVRGSESGGRIILEDIKAYIQNLQVLAQSGGSPAASSGPAKPAAESIDFSKWGPVKKTPLTSLRKAISQKMVESWTTIPHVTQQDSADITDVMALRKKFVEKYEKKGAALTLTVIILKALAHALKKHPKFNSSLDEATQELVTKEYIHIGIAVDTEQGLIVPVIRDIDKKSALQIAKDLQDLAEKTRQRKVALDDLKGGTFTISNQGGIGGGYFTPIINKPEIGILGIGKGMLTAAVINKAIEQRMMLPLSLSYDHRLVDGGDAVRFLNDVVKEIQEFKAKDLEI